MPKRILLIDDEDLIIKSLVNLLKFQGYDVSVANSGKDALEKVRQQEFDLIICDILMPGLDGVETIKGIRELLNKKGRQPVPEILITGYADKAKYEEAESLNVAGYLFKPFDNAELLGTVKGIFSGR